MSESQISNQAGNFSWKEGGELRNDSTVDIVGSNFKTFIAVLVQKQWKFSVMLFVLNL